MTWWTPCLWRTKRLLSPAYLRGGMGDGGGCHPRDNIALSWLAREVDLSYDLFEALMVCRERQTEWLAELIVRRDMTDDGRRTDRSRSSGRRTSPKPT